MEWVSEPKKIAAAEDADTEVSKIWLTHAIAFLGRSGCRNGLYLKNLLYAKKRLIIGSAHDERITSDTMGAGRRPETGSDKHREKQKSPQ